MNKTKTKQRRVAKKAPRRVPGYVCAACGTRGLKPDEMLPAERACLVCVEWRA